MLSRRSDTAFSIGHVLALALVVVVVVLVLADVDVTTFIAADGWYGCTNTKL